MPDFKRSIGISLALHALIFTFFMVKFMYFSKPIIDLSQAISVSVGELKDNDRLPEKPEPEAFSKPDEEAPPPQKIIEVEKKTPVVEIKPKIKEPPKPDSISLAKAKQKSALEKLKKSAALDKIRQDLKNDSISKLKAQEKKTTVTKPRIVAAGSTLSGLDKLQAGNYLDEVDKSIKQFWSLPQWLLNKSLKARALVKFNMQGQIQSSKIISSSGNNSYDQYCLKAIADAAPFPKVPEKLTEKFSVDGVVIGFPE